MSPRARIALLALLVAGAVVLVRVPAADRPQPEARRRQAGDADEAFAVVMLLVVPALALLIFAALRYGRRPRPRQHLDDRQLPSWRQALFALTALVLVAVVFGLLARLTRPERQVQDGRTRRGDGQGAPESTPPPTRPRSPAEDGSAFDFDLWSGVLVLLFAALLVASVLSSRGRRPTGPPPEDEPPPPGPIEPPLVEAVRRALSTVDRSGGDPRATIIGCYAAMEQALAAAPGAEPRPADTPSDVLRRATDAGQVQADSGARLVGLFAEARYSSHPMTEDDRAAAAGTLRRILHDLRGPVWIRS